ncbi:hypothetical protein EDC01DRAFT_731135 [Geopyxis carbonaria]|nr:hypothetical protein EDC01DRAFT_731135 [Geopyxis carbonaria]
MFQQDFGDGPNLPPGWLSRLRSSLALRTGTDNEKKRRCTLPSLPTKRYHKLKQAFADLKQRLERNCWPWNTLSGWRMGVLWCSVSVAIVLLINLISLMVEFYIFGTENGIGTIYSGSCTVTKRVNLCLHLAINGFSTVILSGSNYTQQCLISPTRKEIDKYHKMSPPQWMDIGVPSVRNWSKISASRKTLWLLIGLTSVPLHLLYNSSVFAVNMAVNYRITVDSAPNIMAMIADENSTRSWENRTAIIEVPMTETNRVEWQRIKRGMAVWKNLTTAECLQTYNTDTLRQYRNLRDVVHNGRWEFCGSEVEWCYAEEIAEECSVQFPTSLLIIVIVFNAVKIACMILALVLLRPARRPGPKTLETEEDREARLKLNEDDEPLITVGDAIQSFVKFPDKHTETMGLITRKDVVSKGPRNIHPTDAPLEQCQQRRWQAISLLVLLKIGLATELDNTKSGMKFLWSRGLGNPSQWARIGSTLQHMSIGAAALLANSPQIIISFLYLTYNAIFTGMLMASELDNFAARAKSLRVTKPIVDQRSTYWLQLPYTYSVPLMILSGTLHWLASQSLFLLRGHYKDENFEEIDNTGVGFSSIGIILIIPTGALALVYIVLSGRSRVRNMPLTGSCSLAISAACHVPDSTFKQREEMVIRKLYWSAAGSGSV